MADEFVDKAELESLKSSITELTESKAKIEQQMAD